MSFNAVTLNAKHSLATFDADLQQTNSYMAPNSNVDDTPIRRGSNKHSRINRKKKKKYSSSKTGYGRFYDMIYRQSLEKEARGQNSRPKRTRGSSPAVFTSALKPIKYLKLSPLLRNNCSFHACYAPIRNLLIGRKKFIYASSTCGLKMPERFCILGTVFKIFKSNF